MLITRATLLLKKELVIDRVAYAHAFLINQRMLHQEY